MIPIWLLCQYLTNIRCMIRYRYLCKTTTIICTRKEKTNEPVNSWFLSWNPDIAYLLSFQIPDLTLKERMCKFIYRQFYAICAGFVSHKRGKNVASFIKQKVASSSAFFVLRTRH
jgi:hypothetical protein